jgi:hypothetical protein
MILRRLVASIRGHDWFTVAVETVIVVLGVFLGLQVNNWEKARGDRAREGVHLASLAQDIRNDVAEIDEINRVSGLRMSAMGFLLERARGRPLPSGFDSARGRIAIEPSAPFSEDNPNSIGIAIFIFTPFDGNRLTYDTLVNTGDIAIMRNVPLVRRIQTYYANVDKVRHFEGALEQNRAVLVDAQQRAGLSPIDEMPPSALAVRFSRNPGLMAAAANYWLYTNRHLKLMRDLRIEAVALASAIQRGRANGAAGKARRANGG